MSCPKIVCVGRNYVEHIAELGNEVPEDIVFFLKPASAVADELAWREGLHYEGEICFRVRDGRLAEVAFGLDLTLREVQTRLKSKGLPWERAKAFKGSALFRDFVPINGWEGLELRLYKNGALAQQGSVEQMIYKPDVIFAEADAVFGLDKGDIIMSGTPKGVGPLKRGDVLRGEVWQGGELLTAKEWRVV